MSDCGIHFFFYWKKYYNSFVRLVYFPLLTTHKRINVKYSTSRPFFFSFFFLFTYKYMYIRNMYNIYMCILKYWQKETKSTVKKKLLRNRNRPKKYEVEYRWQMVRISQINSRLSTLCSSIEHATILFVFFLSCDVFIRNRSSEETFKWILVFAQKCSHVTINVLKNESFRQSRIYKI